MSRRTMDEINNEYGRTAAQAGEAQFKISRIQKDIESFNKRLLDLNLEAVALQGELAKEASEAAKAAEAPALAVVPKEEG